MINYNFKLSLYTYTYIYRKYFFKLYIYIYIYIYISFVLIVFNWNHFEMRLLNLRIIFYLLRTFCPHLGSFRVDFFFHYVSAKLHLWPSSGDLPRPRIGMMSLVTVFPVITLFHSCCLSHHVFDQVNLWPAWVGFETAIFWQCSPGTKPARGLLGQKRGAIDNNYGRQ